MILLTKNCLSDDKHQYPNLHDIIDKQLQVTITPIAQSRAHKDPCTLYFVQNKRQRTPRRQQGTKG